MANKDVTAELPIGVVDRSLGRTIGEGEFALLTTLTWTTSELHTNAEYCKQTEFGERILPGAAMIPIASGLWTNGQRRRLAEDYGVTFVAALGYDKVRLRSPFFPGDTVWVESEITSIRPSQSRPGMAILEFHHRGINQRGLVVVEFDHQALIRRGPAE